MVSPVQICLVAAALVASAAHAEPARALREEATATFDLLGEEVVNAGSVFSVADKMVAEADRIWSSSGWHLISNNTVVNEGIAVSGVFAKSGVELTRASAVIDAPAQKIFELLTSVEGYKIIDPFSNAEDHAKPPLESFDATLWRGAGTGKRLEVARTTANIPLFSQRVFIVLNAIDPTTRYFVSKSVQHSAEPGCSGFGPASCSSLVKNSVRALNTFAVQVEPVRGNAAKSVIRLVNYADLAGNFAAFLSNQVNKSFLVDLVGRVRKAVAA